MLSTDLDRSETAYLRREVDFIERWLGTGKPLLGICLGAQMMATALGTKVGPREDKRYQLGFVEIEPTAQANGFLAGKLGVYHWHQEGFDLPKGAVHLATGPDFPHQAIRHGKAAYGIQFHPEVAPPTFQRWLDEVPDWHTRLGADPREKQVADAERFDRSDARLVQGLSRPLGRALAAALRLDVPVLAEEAGEGGRQPGQRLAHPVLRFAVGPVAPVALVRRRVPEELLQGVVLRGAAGEQIVIVKHGLSPQGLSDRRVRRSLCH